MEKLSKDWLSTGLIDFEYKKYTLLAYLKHIRKEFVNIHLYPALSELLEHHKNLIGVKENKREIYENFPKSISALNFKNWSVKYKTIDEDGVFNELENIITYALPLFSEVINEGKELYDFVEENMELQPVGIVPMYLDEGYMMMKVTDSRELSIYRYQISVFEDANEKYRGINIQFKAKDSVSIGRTMESVKAELIRNDKSLPNPATFAVINKMKLPEVPTLLPIAKRLLIRYVTAA